MITMAKTVALGLRTRSYSAREQEAMGIKPSLEAHQALVQLRGFLERFQSNYLVIHASAEDRAKLEEFWSAIVAPKTTTQDRGGVWSAEDRIADHAKAFFQLTTPPQRSWLAQQLRVEGRR